MQPKQINDTLNPVDPNRTYSIDLLLMNVIPIDAMPGEIGAGLTVAESAAGHLSEVVPAFRSRLNRTNQPF
jgi:hypothetical protein